MFRDSLQKRLQEMERESLSPSLENAKPTLKERVEFLGRYLSRVVEQVPQKRSIYGSLDDQLNDHKSAVEFEGHTGQGQYWINKAFEHARSGETWDNIESDLRIAKEKTGYNGSVSPDLMEKLETLYSEGIKVEGPKKAGYWVDKAFAQARSGELWDTIESDLRIAGKYARESGTELDVDMDSLRTKYTSGIKTFGPRKAEYWGQRAGEELSKGRPQSEINFFLRIARRYASEAGMNF